MINELNFKISDLFIILNKIVEELKALSENQNRVMFASNILNRKCKSSSLSLIPKSTYQNNTDDGNCQIFSFSTQICFMCNGYYGASYEDPTCSACHAFLYPNYALTAHLTTLQLHGSSNELPYNNNYHYNRFVGQNQGYNACSTKFRRFLQQFTKLVMSQNAVELNINYLPPEIMLNIFKYLDDMSLWSVGQVCVRWRSILDMLVKPERWENLTLSRWPLLLESPKEGDWYSMFTAMMKNSWCSKCVRQMAAHECPTIEQTSWRKYRLRSELRAMKADPLQGIKAKPLDSSCCHWQATIEGPVGSPYEGGLFFLYIQIPYTYPMCPPVIRFLTRIFHPNVSRHGDIGIDSIHHNWSLVLTISKVLISIQSLLTDPYCHVCMEPDVGKLYMENKKGFEEQARLWTMKYAIVNHDD